MFYSPPEHARHLRDHYATPPELVHALVIGLRQGGLTLPTPVHDPCAGAGKLIDELTRLGFTATGSDLHPDEYPPHPAVPRFPVDAGGDEPTLPQAAMLVGARSIVTNPPYGRQAERIVEAGVRAVRNGAVGTAAYLLPLPWEAAGRPSRLKLMRAVRLRIVCCWRPEWIDGTGGGGKMNYAWLVWTPPGLCLPQTVYVEKP
jgi:hypothetical protein